MAWLLGSRQAVVPVVATVDTETRSYCTSVVCTCGKNCHNDPDYHLTFTTWNGHYPQLDEGFGFDSDLFERAMATLGGG